MTRSRQEALVARAQELETELAQAWANGMSIRRLKALRESLDSARSELRSLLRAEAAEKAKLEP